MQFEITKGTREAVAALIKLSNLHSKDFLFRSRVGTNQHISTRQYNRIFHGWVEKLGLEDSLYSTHSMRRTKPYLIYKKTKNLRVIQLLLGHKKVESTVRYLGIEVDDALEISESTEVSKVVRAATAALCQERTMRNNGFLKENSAQIFVLHSLVNSKQIINRTVRYLLEPPSFF